MWIKHPPHKLAITSANIKIKTGKNISLSVIVVITPTTNTLAITSANNK